MKTTQKLIGRPPTLLEHNFTLTIRCQCGRLRNFAVDATIRSMSEKKLAGVIINTECPHCKQHFEVGLGLYNNARDFTGMTPDYLKAEGFVVQDDVGLSIPDKPAREQE